MKQTVSETFEANRKSGRKTLIGYFPLGFPSLDESVEAAVAMCHNLSLIHI